jgi:hypothetical protein
LRWGGFFSLCCGFWWGCFQGFLGELMGRLIRGQLRLLCMVPQVDDYNTK